MERKSQRRWDAENMATCSCRLRRCDYEELQGLCASKGMTVHAAMRYLIGRFLLNVGAGEDMSPGLRRDAETRRL